MARRDRRQEIMDAAEKLFTTRRLHEITLDDVVKEARVGKGTVYLHFKDKDDLFFQVATSGFDQMCALLRRNVPKDAPFPRRLLGACGQISEFFLRRRQLFRMMQSEDARMYWCKGAIRDRWLQSRRSLVAAVADIIAGGVSEGSVRPDVAPEALAHFLLGMLRTQARDLEDMFKPAHARKLAVELFCNAVRPADPRPRAPRRQGKPSPPNRPAAPGGAEA
ncbi:MAG: TetR/AcrR family transcriptional regulator [Planctomycetaceae bacterium]|nr:TetR/AcrR family transcriptional regulator [Planctomycetaceae bacterium]